MKLAIMQPYFFPYIGYFQLMNLVDEFVVYDNIEYTKKGWFNRNRILVNGKASNFTVPLKKASDFSSVADRQVSEIWQMERHKLLRRITAAYAKAPFYSQAFPIVEKCMLNDEIKLFNYILTSLTIIKSYLDISTPLCISSTIPIDHSMKGECKVIEICKKKGANVYYNPEGGKTIYNKGNFKENGVDIKFLITRDVAYPQFNHDFVERLSIIDMMMFLPKEKIIDLLNAYYIE